MKIDKKFSPQLLVIRALVLIWDIITFPIYYLIQQPWKTLAAAHAVRAKQEDSSDPYSPWYRIGEQPRHYLFSCKTMPEAVQKSLQVNGRNRSALGVRKILDEFDEKQSNGKVLKKYLLTDYQWSTIGEIDDRIESIARGLLLYGIKPRTPVLIFAETRIEWFLTAHAIFRLGASIATLYATLGEEGLVYGVNETEVTQIVTTQDLLPKLAKIIKRTPKVQTIIYVEGFKKTKPTEFESNIQLVPFSRLEEEGKSAPEDLKGIPPTEDDIAVILYTSGSTGMPKGVITTHKNMLAACCSVMTIIKENVMEDVDRHMYLAYLPLAHSLEFTAESFMFMAGVRIGYGTPYTLTDQGTAISKGQRGDAVLLQPTAMVAVPLILDRIRKGINDNLEKKSPFVRELFNFMIGYKIWWERRGFNTPLINKLVCKKLNAQIGGKLEFMLVGGAPLSPDTQRIMKACLNIKLLQGFGSTETTSTATIMDMDDISSGRIGAPLCGAKIKLIDWIEGGYRVTDKPNPRGELVVGGKFIAKGYYKLDKETKEAFENKDGVHWFYTGDIGEVFPDGTFKIIDRKKDLVKLQFGEYISLGKVEAELKSCQFVDNVCVYGDSFHTNLVALIVPNAKAIKTIAERVGNISDKLNDWCKDPKIVNEITNELTKHGMSAGLLRMEIPTKIKLCTDEWTPDNGLVTAALKLKRKNIQNYYQTDIDRMYGKVNNNIKSA